MDKKVFEFATEKLLEWSDQIENCEDHDYGIKFHNKIFNMKYYLVHVDDKLVLLDGLFNCVQKWDVTHLLN